MNTIAVFLSIPVALGIFGVMITIIRRIYELIFHKGCTWMSITEIVLYSFTIATIVVELFILALVYVSALIEKLLLC